MMHADTLASLFTARVYLIFDSHVFTDCVCKVESSTLLFVRQSGLELSQIPVAANTWYKSLADDPNRENAFNALRLQWQHLCPMRVQQIGNRAIEQFVSLHIRISE